jgi:hypothetical protein
MQDKTAAQIPQQMGDCSKQPGQIQKNQFKIQIIIINTRPRKIQPYRICREKKCLKRKELLFAFLSAILAVLLTCFYKKDGLARA